MIAASFKNKQDKDVILLGITDMNIEKLKEGKPIITKVHKYCKDCEVSEIIIMYGATEFAIHNELRKHNLITDNTEKHYENFVR